MSAREQIESFVGGDIQHLLKVQQSYNATMISLEGDLQQTKRAIKSIKFQKENMKQDEIAERKRMNQIVNQLNLLRMDEETQKTQNNMLMAKKNELEAYLEQLLIERNNEERILGEERLSLFKQTSILTSHLGINMIPHTHGTVLVILTLIDPNSPSREFSFIIRSSPFRVEDCKPMVPYQKAVLDLNRGGEFLYFIKEMRSLFLQSTNKT
eukprot:TRINITY_DN1336_c0_g1_i1.p1 TRINITY_DN1336_c0_g1~~TRINITY_DN1336_c0_g1_i1.p1  ORF type:complete len:211 (-),score=45.82 TRINITY_DN1336_c0_g1_i1:42-674(-)